MISGFEEEEDLKITLLNNTKQLESLRWELISYKSEKFLN